MKHIKTSLLSVGLSLLMVSCGFHLRGVVKPPNWFTDVYVMHESSGWTLNSPLQNLMAEELKAQGVRVVAGKEPAQIILWLGPVESKSSETTTGSLTEYTLKTVTDYKVYRQLGKNLLSGQSVQIGSYEYAEGRVLASETQKRALEQELREETVSHILSHISRFNAR